MSYQQALHAMRWAMTLPWEANQTPVLPEEAAAFTLHSLKTSLLSAANQLRLPEEDRRHQGHHKKDCMAGMTPYTGYGYSNKSPSPSAAIGGLQANSTRRPIPDGGTADTPQTRIGPPDAGPPPTQP